MHVHAAPNNRLQPRRMQLQRRKDDSRPVHEIRPAVRSHALPKPRSGNRPARGALQGRRHHAVRCHLGINRTNIETGHRLDEGPARQAAKARVATIRELDARYGLKQMERGKSNSLLHGRQPGRAERDMARKGQASRSENARIRATVARRIDEVGRIPGCHDRMKELARRLAKDGITLSRSKNGSLQYCFYSKSLGGTRKVNGARLGFARNARTGAITRFTVRGIKVALNSLAREMVNEMGREDDRR